MASAQTVGDPTDPKGTLRPNLPAEPTTGSEFKPLHCPPFVHKINLPTGIASNNAFAIWSLFFTRDQLEIIAQNTNLNAKQHFTPGRGPHARRWKDTSVEELYTYLGILVYMGLHPENDIASYWIRKPEWPAHSFIWKAMSCTRWQAISRAFHLSEPGKKSVFAKASISF
jgi:hypothetical protein